MQLSRKSFVTNTCKAVCLLAGGSALATLIESCAPFKVYKSNADKGRITVPISELAIENTRIIRDNNLDYDIFLSKKENVYTALKMKCTHQDWMLSATKNGFNCTAHGSSFDLSGKVTNGPAAEPLKSFKTTIENNQINIYLNQ